MADLGSFTASVSGLSGIVANTQAAVESICNQANYALGVAIDSTYDGSQLIVPVDKGDLQASGTRAKGDLQGSVTYGTDHCWYVELGTVKMAAQPYLYPPFETACRQLDADLRGIKI